MPDETSATISLFPGDPSVRLRASRTVYWQILLTYFHRPVFWLFAFFIAMGFCTLLPMVLASGQSGPRPLWSALFPGGICSIMFFFFVISQLKEQLASFRSALLPGYRAAHVVVAGLLAAPIFTILPAVLSVAFHTPLISPAGLIFALFALLAWGLYMGNFVYNFVFLVWMSFYFLPSRQFYINVLAGKYPTLAALMFVGGILAFAVLVRRMLRISEQTPEYFKNLFPSKQVALSQRGGASGNPPIAKAYGNRWLAWICAPAEEDLRVPRAAHLTVWGFLIRRRALEGGQNIFTALAFLLPFGILLALLQGGNRWQPKSIGHFLLAWQGLVFPAFILLIGISKRIPCLKREMLLPLTRRQFLLAHAMLLARDLAFMWIFAATALIAVLALFDGPCLRDPAFWLGLLMAAFSEVLASALVLWIFRTHIFWVGVVVSILLGALFPGGMFVAKGILSLSPSVVILLLFSQLVLAVIIFADAARRWMRADFA